MKDLSETSRDWTNETRESVNARLAGARHVQDQIRFTLGLMAIISTMILIASYNAYLSYDHAWVLENASRSFSAERRTADILTEQAIRSWADSRNVLLSLVGIRVNVDDAPVLGTSSLLFVSLWLLMLTRRENRIVGFLLRDTDSAVGSADIEQTTTRRQTRWLIFHAIASNSLFMNVDDSLARVGSLEGPNPTRRLQLHRMARRLEPLISRLPAAFFFSLPYVACLAMFGLDRWSYFQPSAFRPNSSVPGMSDPFFWRSSFVFLLWFPLAVCCRRARLYVRATENIVREYRATLHADEPTLT